MAFDPTTPGRAAIAVGDVDSADHVAMLVPGMTARVTPYLGGLAGDAQRLQHFGTQALGSQPASRTIATVAWIGYVAPELTDVWNSSRARAGAPALAAAVQGIHAARAATGTDVHLTVVAHSYGTHVAGLAARDADAIDDLVLMGSPGIGVDSAGGLAVPTGHVYVAEATGDPVADADWFGADLQAPRFGAVPLQTDGGPHPLAGSDTLASTGHSEYYLPDSESLWNITAVVIGRPEDTTQGTNRGVGDLARPPLFPLKNF